MINQNDRSPSKQHIRQTASLYNYYKWPPRTPYNQQRLSNQNVLTVYSCNPPQTPIKMPKCGSKSPVRNIAYTESETPENPLFYGRRKGSVSSTASTAKNSRLERNAHFLSQNQIVTQNNQRSPMQIQAGTPLGSETDYRSLRVNVNSIHEKLFPRPQVFHKFGSVGSEDANQLFNSDVRAQQEVEKEFDEIESSFGYRLGKVRSLSLLDVDNLISISTKKLEVDPSHKKALFIRASSLMKKGEFFKAIQDCNSLIAIDDQNSKIGALFIRGCIYEKIGELDQAIGDLSEVLELDPTHINAAYARGACLNKKGNFAKAIQDYNFALQVDKERPLSPRKIPKWKAEYILNQPIVAKAEDSVCSTGRPLFTPTKGHRSTSQERSATFSLQIESAKKRVTDFKTTPQSGKLRQLSPTSNSPSYKYNQLLHNASVSSFKVESHQKYLKATPVKGEQASVLDLSLNSTPGQQSKYQSSQNSPLKQNQQANEERMKLKKEAEVFHGLGYEARKKGDYVSAINYYTQALEIFPQHFKVIFNRGFAFDKLGQYDLAIADYKVAISLAPQNAFAYYNLGISLDKKGDYDSAVHYFTQAIEIDPHKADFYHNRGFAWRKKKEMIRAIQDYTTAIEKDHYHFKAFYNRAFCFDKIGDLAQAERDYKIAVELQPQNATTLYHLATIQERIGVEVKLKEAIENFDKVINMDCHFAEAFNGRGLAKDRLGKGSEALQDFTEAIERDENNALFWHNRGCCHRTLQNYQAALVDLNQALRIDCGNAVSFSNRGLVKRKLGDYEGAIRDYSEEMKLISSVSSKVKALNNRAFCFAKLEKFAEAIQDYSEVIEIDAHNVHAFHNRGISYERQGDFEKAIFNFSEAIRLEPLNANAHFNRGICYDEIGDLQKAIEDYSRALELDIENNSEGSKEIVAH